MPAVLSDKESEIVLLASRSCDRNETVRRIARIADETAIDWGRVSDLAARHHVLPQLWRHVSGGGPALLPTEPARRLREKAQWIGQRSLRQTADLLRITSLLSDNGVDALAYKGPVLAALAYGSLPREQSDLDILVRDVDLDRSVEVLRRDGYRPDWTLTDEQKKLHRKYGYEQTLIADGDRINIELHWNLDASRYRIGIETPELFERAHSVKVGSGFVRTLSHEDLFVFLCWHGAKHFWKPLRLVVDLAGLIDSCPEIDYRLVARRGRQAGVFTSIAVGLSLCRDLLGCRLPQGALQSVPITRKAEGIARDFCADLFSDEPWFHEKPWTLSGLMEESRAQIALRDGIANKMLTGLSLVFEPSERDAADGAVIRNPYLVKMARMLRSRVVSRSAG